jgi:hypothetical protein
MFHRLSQKSDGIKTESRDSMSDRTSVTSSDTATFRSDLKPIRFTSVPTIKDLYVALFDTHSECPFYASSVGGVLNV